LLRRTSFAILASSGVNFFGSGSGILARLGAGGLGALVDDWRCCEAALRITSRR